MDWINCNLCCRQPCDEKERQFMITSCGHIICDLCLSEAESRDKCRVCSEQCQLIQLSSNMRSEVGIFFQEPVDLLKKHHSQMRRLCEFQKNHRIKLVTFHRKMLLRFKELERQYKLATERIQTLEKENLKLKELLNSRDGSSGGEFGGLGGTPHPHESYQRVITASAMRNSPQGSQAHPAFAASRLINGRITLSRGKVGSPATRVSPNVQQSGRLLPHQMIRGGAYPYSSQVTPTGDIGTPMHISPDVSRISSPYGRNAVSGGRYYIREANPYQQVGSQNIGYSQNKNPSSQQMQETFKFKSQSPNPLFFTQETQGGSSRNFAYPRY